jgi:hypothetical protein
MVDVPTFNNPLATAIFVFGSNFAGRHDTGSSDIAYKYYGAKMGVRQGITGEAYALPIENAQGQQLSLYEINQAVNKFISYAYSNRDRFFQVTRIGCGLNGYSDEQIAPLFERAPANVLLPGKWILLLNRLVRARLVVTGSLSVTSPNVVTKILEEKTAPWGRRFEVITPHTSGVAVFAEKWARHNDLPTTPFTADYERFGIEADYILNQQMAWYGTIVINFSDTSEDLTSNMTYIAKRDGLKTLVIECKTTLQSVL